jgi:hypothetical protein
MPFSNFRGTASMRQITKKHKILLLAALAAKTREAVRAKADYPLA